MRIRVFDETLPAVSKAVLQEIDTGEDSSEGLTLRELIGRRIRQEIERHKEHPGEVFAGLVQPEEPERILNGVAERRTPDWEAQVRAACSSFERNGFLVLVDDEQVTDLDAPLRLRAGSKVSFVKLTPLIGG